MAGFGELSCSLFVCIFLAAQSHSVTVSFPSQSSLQFEFPSDVSRAMHDVQPSNFVAKVNEDATSSLPSFPLIKITPTQHSIPFTKRSGLIPRV